MAHTTHGLSDYGVDYVVDGTRCSGDTWTSISNGKINAFNTYVALRHIPHDAWDSIHEGDDGFIGVAREYIDEAKRSIEDLDAFGFKVKVDAFNDIGHVSFCGRHYYRTPYGVRSHCDLMRSLAKFHTTVSNCKPDALLLAKALSYYHTDKDTPLIGPLTRAIIVVLRKRISFSSFKRATHAINKERYMAQQQLDYNAISDLPECDITAHARASVAYRTGISLAAQQRLEAGYASMIARDSLLVLPKIPAEWDMRNDGHVFGEPTTWIA